MSLVIPLWHIIAYVIFTILYIITIAFSVTRVDLILNGTSRLWSSLEYIALLAVATLVVNVCYWVTGWDFMFLMLSMFFITVGFFLLVAILPKKTGAN